MKTCADVGCDCVDPNGKYWRAKAEDALAAIAAKDKEIARLLVEQDVVSYQTIRDLRKEIARLNTMLKECSGGTMTFHELMKQHLSNIKARAIATRRTAQDYDIKAGIIEQEMREFENLLDRWEQETKEAGS